MHEKNSNEFSDRTSTQEKPDYDKLATEYFNVRGKHKIFYQLDNTKLIGRVESKDMITFYKAENPKLKVDQVCMPLQTYLFLKKTKEEK